MTLAQAQTVLDLLRSQWPSDAVARYFTRHPDGGVFGGAVSNAQELANAANWGDDGGWNSYLEVNPTTQQTGTRVNSDAITHWSWFLVDLDPVGDDPMLDEAQEWVKMFVQNYLGLIKLGVTVIDSGRGRQLWFPITPMPTDSEIKVWDQPHLNRNLESTAEGRMITIREAAPRAMAYWLGMMRERMPDKFGVIVDTSVSDLPRVMRLPFTVNTKTKKMAYIMAPHSNVNVGLGEKLITYAPYVLWRDQASISRPGPTASSSWTEYIPYMTRGGRIFITEGSSEGGRHRAASAAMLSLLELGCPIDEIKSALRFGGQLSTPVLEPKETDAMIERRRKK